MNAFECDFKSVNVLGTLSDVTGQLDDINEQNCFLGPGTEPRGILIGRLYFSLYLAYSVKMRDPIMASWHQVRSES